MRCLRCEPHVEPLELDVWIQHPKMQMGKSGPIRTSRSRSSHLQQADQTRTTLKVAQIRFQCSENRDIRRKRTGK